jgi:predicted HicB family RNase H-like nuclease
MTSGIMEYKGYAAFIHYSDEDEVFYGKVEGIRDLISFGGKSAKELKKAFRESIDEYLEDCKREGKEPDKPYKGSFNVRVSPELHSKAAIMATKRGITLNQLVKNALEKELVHAR